MQGTSPNAQKTQHSPAAGSISAPHVEQEWRTLHKPRGMSRSFAQPQKGQVSLDFVITTITTQYRRKSANSTVGCTRISDERVEGGGDRKYDCDSGIPQGLVL